MDIYIYVYLYLYNYIYIYDIATLFCVLFYRIWVRIYTSSQTHEKAIALAELDRPLMHRRLHTVLGRSGTSEPTETKPPWITASDAETELLLACLSVAE